MTKNQYEALDIEAKDLAESEFKLLKSHKPACGDSDAEAAMRRVDIVDAGEISLRLKKAGASGYPLLRAIECAIHNLFSRGDLADSHIRMREFFTNFKTLQSGVYGIATRTDFKTAVSRASDAFIIKISKKEVEFGIHEAFIGTMVVNFLRFLIPNFVYTLGFAVCTQSVVVPESDSPGKVVSFCAGNEAPSAYIILENLNAGGDLKTLEDLISEKSIRPIEVIELLAQVTCALMVGYNTFGFVHNDLHAGNILVRAAPGEGEFFIRYPTSGEDVYVKSRKRLAMIIDLGLARAEYDSQIYAITQPGIGHYRKFVSPRSDMLITVGMLSESMIHDKFIADEDELLKLVAILFHPVLLPSSLDSASLLKLAKTTRAKNQIARAIKRLYKHRFRMPVIVGDSFDHVEYAKTALSLAHKTFGGSGKLVFTKRELPANAIIFDPLKGCDRLKSLLDVLTPPTFAPITNFSELLLSAQLAFRAHSASVFKDALTKFDFKLAINTSAKAIAALDAKIAATKISESVSLEAAAVYVDLAVSFLDHERLLAAVESVFRGTSIIDASKTRFERLQRVLEDRVGEQARVVNALKSSFRKYIETTAKEIEKINESGDRKKRVLKNKIARHPERRESLEVELENLRGEIKHKRRKVEAELKNAETIVAICTEYNTNLDIDFDAKLLSFATRICASTERSLL